MAEVKLNEWFQGGFNLYKENFGLLVLAGVVVVVLGGVTLGVLAGPLSAGLVMMTLTLHDRREPKPQMGDVFKGFQVFLDSFLLFLVWGLGLMVASMILGFIPFLGQIASLALGILVQTLLLFALFLIVERKMPFWPASLDSINTVKAAFWPFCGVGAILSIINTVGALACGIGLIFAVPLVICVSTVAYRDVYGSAPDRTVS